MNRCEQLRHREATIRGAAVVSLEVEELADLDVFVAFLERVADLEVTGGSPVAVDTATDEPVCDPCEDGAEAPVVTVAALFEVALDRMSPPGDALAVAAFERVLASGHRSARHLAEALHRIAWSDEADAVRRLAPALLAASARTDLLVRGRTESGFAALFEIAMRHPVHWDLLRSVVQEQRCARALLDHLEAGVAELDGDELTEVIACAAAHDRPRALRALSMVAASRPLALGFAALLDEAYGPRFREALVAGAACRGPEARNLFHRLDSCKRAPGFPVGLFLARHGDGIEIARRLHAYTDPDFQTWLVENAADPTSPRRLPSLCLLVRAGRHHTEPTWFVLAQACFAQLATFPGKSDEAALLDLVAATPQVPSLVPWLRELAAARPLLFGVVAVALQLAHSLSHVGADRDATLALVEAYATEGEAKGQGAEDAKPVPGDIPACVLGLAQALAAPDALVARLRALFGPPNK